jgi:hypothetical protein
LNCLEVAQRWSLFDAGEKGDGIQAHIYGTQLSSDNKEKFLEYLKTL